MIEALLTEPYPAKVKLKKDLPYISPFFPQNPYVVILSAGSVGVLRERLREYRDVYVFEAIPGNPHTSKPFLSSNVLARLDDWVEVGND